MVMASFATWHVVIAADVGGLTPPRFPPRYSANVEYTCSDQGVSCTGVDVQTVYQDSPNNRSLWRGVSGGPFDSARSDILFRRFPHADPATPEAHGLSRISWKTNNCSQDCSYAANAAFPLLFTPTPHVFEKKESVDGIMCHKWSNNVTIGPPPYLPYVTYVNVLTCIEKRFESPSMTPQTNSSSIVCSNLIFILYILGTTQFGLL